MTLMLGWSASTSTLGLGIFAEEVRSNHSMQARSVLGLIVISESALLFEGISTQDLI